MVGVGAALTLEKRRRWFTGRRGIAAGYGRFRRWASFLMNNDAVSFALMAWFTRGSLALPIPSSLRLAGGIGCILLGAAVKLWARAALGSSGYHWRDFFEPNPTTPSQPPGPYRYLKNPMYTLGYLHAYGIALVLGSLPGLLLALFDQLTILAFYRAVEKPHFEQLSAGQQ